MRGRGDGGTRALSALLLLAACGRSDGAAGASASVRDSARIRIIENSGPRWPPGNGWTVADTPTVDIGGAAGDANYDFGRVAGAARLSGGIIVVANGETNDIRLYDAAGKHLVTTGRRGSGPGEYQTLTGMWVGPGDSILVSDILVRRLTVLDANGSFARSFSLGGQTGFTIPAAGAVSLSIPSGWFSNGSVLGLA